MAVGKSNIQNYADRHRKLEALEQQLTPLEEGSCHSKIVRKIGAGWDKLVRLVFKRELTSRQEHVAKKLNQQFTVLKAFYNAVNLKELEKNDIEEFNNINNQIEKQLETIEKILDLLKGKKDKNVNKKISQTEVDRIRQNLNDLRLLCEFDKQLVNAPKKEGKNPIPVPPGVEPPVVPPEGKGVSTPPEPQKPIELPKDEGKKPLGVSPKPVIVPASKEEAKEQPPVVPIPKIEPKKTLEPPIPVDVPPPKEEDKGNQPTKTEEKKEKKIPEKQPVVTEEQKLKAKIIEKFREDIQVVGKKIIERLEVFEQLDFSEKYDDFERPDEKGERDDVALLKSIFQKEDFLFNFSDIKLKELEGNRLMDIIFVNIKRLLEKILQAEIDLKYKTKEESLKKEIETIQGEIIKLTILDDKNQSNRFIYKQPIVKPIFQMYHLN